MALQLSETLKETITVYTGLSPPTLFILVALGLPIYYVVSDMFGSSSSHHQRSWDFEEEMQPLPPLSSLRDQRRGAAAVTEDSRPVWAAPALKSLIVLTTADGERYKPAWGYKLDSEDEAEELLSEYDYESDDETTSNDKESLNKTLKGVGTIFRMSETYDHKEEMIPLSNNIII
ncbi:hypothetical protein RJ640_014125 [Escallonia rubra]|uniref:Uncharacterized protein n=1 Tax=Escallonia rubra TaxID=112253 RepID=A0AA88QB75_9ASTE|nr:hypothetical protein RJ640_014125 [Escallonia rubra]